MTLALKRNIPCGPLPVQPSSAPVFDAPGVGSAFIPTSEAVINLLLLYQNQKVLRVLNMRRRPTDHAAGSGVFRYRLRSGCWPRMSSSVFKVREGGCVVFPLAISEEQGDFEPPEKRKLKINFPPLYPLVS